MKTRTITAALTTLLLVGTVFATTSFADDGREVDKRGRCSAGARWELDAEDEGARLELDFEVKTATAGQDWRVKLRHDGDVFARMTKTTHADGDFEVERHVTDTVGTDTLGARAVNLKTAQVCKAHLSI